MLAFLFLLSFMVGLIDFLSCIWGWVVVLERWGWLGIDRLLSIIQLGLPLNWHGLVRSCGFDGLFSISQLDLALNWHGKFGGCKFSCLFGEGLLGYFLCCSFPSLGLRILHWEGLMLSLQSLLALRSHGYLFPWNEVGFR